MEGRTDGWVDGQVGWAGGPKPSLTLILTDPKPSLCGAPTPQLLQYANVGGVREHPSIILMAFVEHPDGIWRDPDGIYGAFVNISEGFGRILMAS